MHQQKPFQFIESMINSFNQQDLSDLQRWSLSNKFDRPHYPLFSLNSHLRCDPNQIDYVVTACATQKIAAKCFSQYNIVVTHTETMICIAHA